MSKPDDEEVKELTASLKTLAIRLKSAEHNEAVPINRLPVELFCMILEYLDRNQLIDYGSVCKRWAYFVAVFLRQRLVISIENKVQPYHWFYLNKRHPPSAALVIDALNEKLDVKLMKNSFWLGLKQLKICNSTKKHRDAQYPRLIALIDLESTRFINHLDALEVLEISQLLFGTLSLPNLKHLATSHLIDGIDKKTMIIDCPQLLSFKYKTAYYVCKNFHFNYPTSITHLYLDQYATKEGFEKFTNLQYLSLKSQDYSSTILSTFQNLKEISFRLSGKGGDPDPDILIELLKERQTLGRGDVALTFCGIPVEIAAQYKQLNARNLLNLWLENYPRLRVPELRWIKVIYYAALEIPADFHEKFCHVKEIRVDIRVDDEDQLVEFLRRFERLESLAVTNRAELGESFYRKLVSSSPVRYLRGEIQEIWMQSSAGLANLDFLIEFKHLVCFTLHEEDIDDQFVYRLFDHFGAFELNYFILNQYFRIKIRRSRKSADYEFSLRAGHLENFDNLDDLLQHIDLECRHFDIDYNHDDHMCDSDCEFNCPCDGYGWIYKNLTSDSAIHRV